VLSSGQALQFIDVDEGLLAVVRQFVPFDPELAHP